MHFLISWGLFIACSLIIALTSTDQISVQCQQHIFLLNNLLVLVENVLELHACYEDIRVDLCMRW